ncbi:periplasmic chaperone for outer membrane proteins Skp [Novosphingobium kunmingense]|uniref:Periplasmic chaperone for outer membrane proteins Skp n=1 Tax=Novosphingobium kunmingense TaxID=1211806 RepID=A0A2N0I394_9SPHN|nr:OmpH family outer membrane protein [Novosphingobium kunmingense]PKB25643.1 periplasmic chaperone for outer membrane proteins Skp [Novosphingobium kunmingense]
MTNFFKPILGLGFVLALAAQPAMAQTRPAANTGTVVAGLGVANLEAVLVNTSAFRTAEQQRPVTYKATIDQYQARARALQTQLQGLQQKLQKDAAVPNANQAALQQQLTAAQRVEEAGKNELNTLIRPVVYSREYVKEQIEEKMDAAVKAVMARRNVSLLLSPQSVILSTQSGYDLSQDIVTEINRVLPSATLTPPAGWEPREIREARAAQAAQPGAAAAPAAKPAAQPDSR